MIKNQKGVGILEILLIVVAVGLIAGAGWLFLQRRDQADTTKTSDVSPIPSLKASTPEDITDQIQKKLIKDKYSKQYKIVEVKEGDQPKAGQMSVETRKQAPIYKANGYNFYTDYDGGSTINVVFGASEDSDEVSSSGLPTKIGTELRKEIASIYTDFGLTKTGSDKNKGYDIFTSKTFICHIDTPEATTSSVSASCGSIAEYTKSAMKYKPFADVIPDADSAMVLTNVKITDSQTAGYQRASISRSYIDSIGGAIALLYRKGSGDWVYFTSTQMALDCPAYKTTDLKNAFRGDQCVVMGPGGIPDMNGVVGQ